MGFTFMLLRGLNGLFKFIQLNVLLKKNYAFLWLGKTPCVCIPFSGGQVAYSDNLEPFP